MFYKLNRDFHVEFLLFDWGYGAAGIKYSTTIELRGDYGFDPPPETIILECEEMWAFHRSVANDVIAEYVP